MRLRSPPHHLQPRLLLLAMRLLQLLLLLLPRMLLHILLLSHILLQLQQVVRTLALLQPPVHSPPGRRRLWLRPSRRLVRYLWTTIKLPHDYPSVGEGGRRMNKEIYFIYRKIKSLPDA